MKKAKITYSISSGPVPVMGVVMRLIPMPNWLKDWLKEWAWPGFVICFGQRRPYSLLSGDSHSLLCYLPYPAGQRNWNGRWIHSKVSPGSILER